MRNPIGWAALTLFSLLFFLFIYAPLLVIIGYSFNSNPVNMMSWEHSPLIGIAAYRALAAALRMPITVPPISKALTRCCARCARR